MFVENALAFLSAALTVQGVLLGLILVASFYFMDRSQEIRKGVRAMVRPGNTSDSQEEAKINEQIVARHRVLVWEMYVMVATVIITTFAMLVFVIKAPQEDLLSLATLGMVGFETSLVAIMTAREVRKVALLYDLVWSFQPPSH